jgi:hypothetical protein
LGHDIACNTHCSRSLHRGDNLDCEADNERRINNGVRCQEEKNKENKVS